ncbi:ATP-grasp domain-containing protein, partial [Actinacidiphila rubida]|uniref:ATP-grasp domain-containing protein n=1 Tax=Actinacidiphila rubida TaxID=310780 RepID=UPI00396A95EE
MCTTPEHAAHAAHQLLASRTIYGEPNTTVLVQEYLPGDEYMVNSLSADGHHVITEMWRSHKTLVGSSPVYDYAELVPAAHDHGTVAGYVQSVLDALGIRWGPAHTEIIVTP